MHKAWQQHAPRSRPHSVLAKLQEINSGDGSSCPTKRCAAAVMAAMSGSLETEACELKRSRSGGASVALPVAAGVQASAQAELRALFAPPPAANGSVVSESSALQVRPPP